MKLFVLVLFLATPAARAADYCDCTCTYKANRPATYEAVMIPQDCDDPASVAQACARANEEAAAECSAAEGTACVFEGCFGH